MSDKPEHTESQRELAEDWLDDHHEYDSWEIGYQTMLYVEMPDGDKVSFDLPTLDDAVDEQTAARKEAIAYLLEHFEWGSEQ
jgi:hypothetical protein